MSLSLVFKALSDGTRREILRLLQKGDLTAGEIANQFNLTKPSISHHLNVLKQADLVQDIRKGQNIHYSLNTTVFQDVLAWFIGVLGNSRQEGQDKKEV
ncbi:MAG: winged helix-turn-helix transcriptional regulator [Syntrophomonadaceae bacterium]|nr:winged helix-turn-helix transcriptional regulator [Syntrophomonadaceae bacterium]